jgi:protein N-terminal glutamine amidohydrolase
MSDAPAYCPFYCEENIWQLCAHPRVAEAQRRVLFISNPERRVAMWGQRAAQDPELPLAWDYHVVLLLRRPGSGWEVWDLDACDPGPRAAEAWLRDSFDHVGLLPPRYTPRFRMIDADEYLRHFRSDRRHMRRPDGSVIQPPPPWPAILGEPPACALEDDGCNLERFIDTEDASFLGQLFELDELRAWLQSESLDCA